MGNEHSALKGGKWLAWVGDS